VASNSKKKTTFAKLKRENDVRERRERKQARRQARRDSPAPDPHRDEPAAAPEIRPT
jgi:protein required for attachment to host cells